MNTNVSKTSKQIITCTDTEMQFQRAMHNIIHYEKNESLDNAILAF